MHMHVHVAMETAVLNAAFLHAMMRGLEQVIDIESSLILSIDGFQTLNGCVKAWNEFGLPLSTTSNEAAKMYDAVLTQYCGVFNDECMGGLEKSVEAMTAADPNFVMGHALANILNVIGTSQNSHTSEKIHQSIDEMVLMMNKNYITPRERMHVDAVKMFAEGDLRRACDKWEAILVDHPTDILAIRLSLEAHYYLGQVEQTRLSLARVLPYWNEQMPIYGCLLGNYAFALVESNLFKEAEDTARKGLQINPRDAISTHALIHVLEYEGRQKEGIHFLNSTRRMWSKSDFFGGHNHWHLALFHIDRGEYEDALGIYDQDIAPRANRNLMGMTDLLDATAFLYRFEMEGQKVEDRWQDIAELCRPHTDDHILVLNDIHILMGCIGAKQTDMTYKLMNTLKEHVTKLSDKGKSSVFQEVGLPLCESFVAAEEGDYATAVELLHPIRYNVVNIGGSNAERDIFNLFLINAALKSSEKRHHQLARCLLSERQAVRHNSSLTERLMARAIALHVE